MATELADQPQQSMSHHGFASSWLLPAAAVGHFSPCLAKSARVPPARSFFGDGGVIFAGSDGDRFLLLLVSRHRQAAKLQNDAPPIFLCC